MANSGQLNTGGYGGRYFEFNWWVNWTNSDNNQCNIGWNLIARAGNVQWYYTKNIKVYIDGNCVFDAGSGKTKCYKNTTFGSGDITLGNANNRYFGVEITGDIYQYGTNNAHASTGWNMPTIVPPTVNPTLPNSVIVQENASWNIDISNPVFKIKWSGANNGTFHIDQYSIDASKNNWTNSWNLANFSTNGGTSGSMDNVNMSQMGLSGGEKIKVRVGMHTNNGTWWGHTYWGGTLTIVSHPTAPNISAPSNVEVDTNFSVNWSGARAGTLGIAGYDLEIRGYNGSTWSNWYRVFTCKNQTSYSAGTPKNLKVNGVNYYSTYGENVRFQFRIKSSDGQITSSDWATSGEVRITVNRPSIPR